MHRSFVTTFGERAGSDGRKVRVTLSHEMFHTFQPRMDKPVGLLSSWFTEGSATLYAIRLPLRFGMLSPGDYLSELNDTAGRYYSSGFAALPNDKIPLRF